MSRLLLLESDSEIVELTASLIGFGAISGEITLEAIPEVIIPPQTVLAGVGSGGWAGPSIAITEKRKKKRKSLYSYQVELERQISIEDEEILVYISQFLFLEAA